jgi:hypothetical protein
MKEKTKDMENEVDTGDDSIEWVFSNLAYQVELVKKASDPRLKLISKNHKMLREFVKIP